MLPGRHGSNESYRYGFQGQEKDDEVKGEGDSYNYKFRMDDPRVGRFFAADPLEAKYPWYSPYQFSGNRVIDCGELEGLEPRKKATVEGERVDSIDQNVVKTNDYAFSDFIGWITGNKQDNKLYKTWVSHVNTETNSVDWLDEANYKQIIMPFAIDYAKSAGWSFGTTWQSAREKISNPSAPNDIVSPETMDFISARTFDPGCLDYLTQIGAHYINSYNKALYGSATGSITPMDLDDPFIGLAFGLKGFVMGGESKAAEGIIYKRTNPFTGEEYFGQAISDERYLARQSEHNSALGVEHDFEIVERAEPGLKLDVSEETHIRNGGGPAKKGGKLANKRYQMNEERYKESGGKAKKPTN